jgi:hypothetical protein
MLKLFHIIKILHFELLVVSEHLEMSVSSSLPSRSLWRLNDPFIVDTELLICLPFSDQLIIKRLVVVIVDLGLPAVEFFFRLARNDVFIVNIVNQRDHVQIVSKRLT